MNHRTRQRVMRTLLGSLLQSEISISEIEEIAEEFYLGSFGRDFGEFVRNAVNTLDAVEEIKPKLLQEEASISAISETINRRRLTKKAVTQLMTLAVPRIKPNSFSTNYSISELLENFINTATPAEVKSFHNILRGEPADAYLKGIARRNREK
jgi:hypothetical protein